jgi:hypothetical protein
MRETRGEQTQKRSRHSADGAANGESKSAVALHVADSDFGQCAGGSAFRRNRSLAGQTALKPELRTKARHSPKKKRRGKIRGAVKKAK